MLKSSNAYFNFENTLNWILGKTREHKEIQKATIEEYDKKSIIRFSKNNIKDLKIHDTKPSDLAHSSIEGPTIEGPAIEQESKIEKEESKIKEKFVREGTKKEYDERRKKEYEIIE